MSALGTWRNPVIIRKGKAFDTRYGVVRILDVITNPNGDRYVTYTETPHGDGGLDKPEPRGPFVEPLDSFAAIVA